MGCCNVIIYLFIYDYLWIALLMKKTCVDSRAGSDTSSMISEWILCHFCIYIFAMDIRHHDMFEKRKSH